MQWRVAFYVAGEDGSVLNWLSLFDEYLVWKAKAMAKDIETHIFAHVGVDELSQDKIESEFSYEHYKVHEPLPEEDLPLKWSEAAPCMGKRVATLHLTASSDTALKMIWSGNTWAFRDKMDEANIKGTAVVVMLCCDACLFV